MLSGSLLLSALLSLPVPASGAQGGSGLMAAAAAAGRPPECSAGTRRAIARGPTVWERARVPQLQRYCDLVARAHAQLASTPDRARAAALLAEAALPGHAAPVVILARADLALGSPADAARQFQKARAIDPRSVEDPPTLHDLAETLRKVGKREEALAAYRALVPRINLLGSIDRRVSVLLEAAHAAMAAAAHPAAPPDAPAGADKPSGADEPGAPQAPDRGAQASAAGMQPGAQADATRARLDEAIAYLREARQRPPTQLTGDVLLSLVLALDRSGDKAQADAALADADETGAEAHTLDYLSAEEDKLALAALSLERRDPAEAAKQWNAFLAGPGGKGPWAGAARARRDALQKKGPKGKRGAPGRAGAQPKPRGAR